MRLSSILRNQKGAFAIMTAFVLLVLIGFAALAVDIANLLTAKNELQNAADAAALAGAQVLYNDEGTQVNAGANLVAYNTALAHLSQGAAVEVNDYASNNGDIQRGHWNFINGGFDAYPGLEPTNLWGVTDEYLAGLTSFVNAVKVVVRRQGTPIMSFFSRIFGHSGFTMEAEAVAWIGFAASIESGDADLPFGICAESITYGGYYTCQYGRTTNSGQETNNDEFNNAAWTSLDYNDVANNSNFRKQINQPECDIGNPHELLYGSTLNSQGGAEPNLLSDIIVCWEKATNRTQPWKVTLPVIECGDANNPQGDLKLMGVVVIDILWINDNKVNENKYEFTPVQMGGWSCDDGGTPEGREACWSSFTSYFNLTSSVADTTPAKFLTNTIYFKPDCTPHMPTGHSGANNYGVLAKRPVLVD